MEQNCQAAFAGVVFSEKTGLLTIRVRKGTSQAQSCAEAAVAGTAHTGHATFAPAVEWTSYSLAELRRDVDALTKASRWAGLQASDVVHVWANELEGTVNVDTVKQSSVAQLLANAQRLVPSRVKVNTVAGPPRPQSRRRDSTPFYAGAAMWHEAESSPVSAVADCTTNFAWYRGNAVWQGTAGHCNNGKPDRFFHGTGQYWETSDDYEGMGIDAMLLKGLNTGGDDIATNIVWFGLDPNTGNSDLVNAANSTGPPLGSGMYINGANSGKVYGVVIDTSAACGAINYTMLDTSRGGTGTAPFTVGGDSGAPVTRWNTSTTAADDHVAVAIHGCGNQFSRFWVTSVHRVNIATGGTGDSPAGIRVLR
jgi:hypothetical protein